jgi:hypothetical protein
MKRTSIPITLGVVLTTMTLTLAADQPQVINVWPGKVPGETGSIGEEKVLESKPGEKQVKARSRSNASPTSRNRR